MGRKFERAMLGGGRLQVNSEKTQTQDIVIFH